MKRILKDKGNGRACNNSKTRMMRTKRIQKRSQEKNNGKECHSNKKIRTMMTKRMKRGSKHERNIKSKRLKVTWVMASHMLHQ
jgi:hypothetical protein